VYAQDEHAVEQGTQVVSPGLIVVPVAQLAQIGVEVADNEQEVH
jgi:hypothetical protein